jgi:hypothetical protein
MTCFIKEDSGPDIIKWSTSRVAEYLQDFARSNMVKLRDRRPQISGSVLLVIKQYQLSEIFEDATSSIVVLKLFYQMHPTEVN